MTKQDEVDEVTFYRIKRFGANTYHIAKEVCGVEIESYQITISPIRDNGIGTLYCNCPGFRIQQFPHERHKHILLGFDYQKRGEPEWALYRMNGTGSKAKIHFVGDSNE